MICPQCQNENPAAATYCLRCGLKLPAREEQQSVGELPTMTARTWKTGDKLMDRYRVLGELGRGGMGVVYQCLDEVGGIEVALKALPPELSHNSSEMAEVRENFQLVNTLVHQHIAAIKTLERDPRSGDYYLILELAEGLDLRKWRKREGGKVSLAGALPILRQVAEALDYAHQRRIIHRDIKPGNVMISPERGIKILDFGLAAQIQTSLSRVSKAQIHTSGTGPYMSPEQWRGRRQDGATDQYALAVMTYELLAGYLPFEAQDQFALRESVIREAPQRPEGLGDEVWVALARGLSKEAAQRYGNCMEFVAALSGKAAASSFQPVANRQPATANQKSKILRVMAGVVLLALLSGGIWYLGKVLPEAKRRQMELANATAEQQAKTAALRTDIEAELARSDFQTAGQKLQELEALAGAGGAKDLRTQYESAVGEHDTMQQYALASVAHDEALKLDRGQGFGAKLDELEVVWRMGEAGRQAKNWGTALNSYEDVLKKARDLAALETQRIAAIGAQNDMTTERQNAGQMKAAEDGGGFWQQAETRRTNAESMLTLATFDEARTGFAGAKTLYVQAKDCAGKVQRCRQARAVCEAALKAAVPSWVKDLSLEAFLNRFAKDDWAAIQKAMAEAGRLEQTNQWEEAGAAWQSAGVLIPSAVKLATVESGLAQATEAKQHGDWKSAWHLAQEVIKIAPEQEEAAALLKDAASRSESVVLVKGSYDGHEISGCRVFLDGVAKSGKTPATLHLLNGTQHEIKLLGQDPKGTVLVSDSQSVTGKEWVSEDWVAPLRPGRVKIVEGPETQKSRELLSKSIASANSIIIVNQAAVRDFQVDCGKEITDVLERAMGQYCDILPAFGRAGEKPDFTLEVNITIAIGGMSGSSTTADVKVRVLDAEGRELADVSAAGRRKVPFPATTCRVTEALEDAAKDLEGRVENGALASSIVSAQSSRQP